MNDKIYWITDEGSEWLIEEVEELTVEVALDYAKRTEDEARRLVEGWRRNGEQVDLTICFDIGSLLKHDQFKRVQELDAALIDFGF